MPNLYPTAFGGLFLATLSAPALAQQWFAVHALQMLGLPALGITSVAALLLWFAPLKSPRRTTSRLDAPLWDTPRPAPEPSMIPTLAKIRVTRLRAQVRRDRPDLLPEIAAYEAMLNRVLRALDDRPEGLSRVRRHLCAELAALEKSSRKLSVVLGTASEEDAADRFRFALVQMTGEAAVCLAALRSMTRHARSPALGFSGGEPARKV